MKLEKLLSTTEFVKWQDNEDIPGLTYCDIYKEKYKNVRRYANFISQPLKLGMFIPTDIHDNVLDYCENPTNALINTNEVNEYNFAKSKVLFKDFEVENWIEDFGYITLLLQTSKYCHSINYNIEKKYFFFDGDSCEIPVNTIEEIIHFEIEPTDSCLKLLNLKN